MSTEQFQSLQNTLLDAMKSISDKTNSNIESLKTAIENDICDIRAELSEHSGRLNAVESQIKESNNSKKIDELTLQIEILKQEKLRNNLRFTGLPQCAFDDPDETILRIAETLNIDLIPSEYTVYADRNKSSIIVCFESYSLKRITMDALRTKKSLFVEEIFDIQSNSRIYANDQLSPYFAELFQCARKAKTDGQIFSVSSLGGRIRVKKNENSQPRSIINKTQLSDVINNDEQMETQANSNEVSQTSHDVNNESKNNTSPQSIDSAGAREIRGKSFLHTKKQVYKTDNTRQLPNATTNNNNRPPQHREQYKKRNNRHVNLLDHRSQQPQGKKHKQDQHTQLQSGHSSRNSVPGESDNYRRQYQNRLRSYTLPNRK